MRNLRKSLIAFGALAAAGVPAAVAAQNQPTTGWVGIAYTSEGQTNEKGQLIFSEYPVIESVEPGSPAERAGLVAGDTILSLNARDLRRFPFPLRSMIQPGSRLAVRLKRQHAIRTYTLTVAPRPRGNEERFAVTFTQQEIPSAIAVARNRDVEVRARAVETRARAIAAAQRRPVAPPAPMTRVSANVPVAPVAIVAPLAFGFGSTSIGVAGADLTRLNEDLGALLGLRPGGIFVVNVAPGTPARRAGLHGGDVILTADGRQVQTPGELIALMQRASDQRLRLEIIRKRQQRNVTLSW